MIIMIQCHAYYMPKDIYHLIFLVQCNYSSTFCHLPNPSHLWVVSVWVGLPDVVHGFQTQFNTNECSGLSSVAIPLHPNSLPPPPLNLIMENEGSEMERSLTLAGKALAIAGPNPFQRAVTPSAAINFRAQSRKPEYVP